MNKEKLRHHALVSVMEAFIIHYGCSGELTEFLRIRGTNPGDYFCGRAVKYAGAIVAEVEKNYHAADGSPDNTGHYELAAYALVAAVKALIIRYGDAEDIEQLVDTASGDYGLTLSTMEEHPRDTEFLLKDYQK